MDKNCGGDWINCGHSAQSGTGISCKFMGYCDCQHQGQRHFRKARIKKICLFCRKQFEVIPYLRAQQFCNISCSRKYLWNQSEFRQNITNKLKGKHNSPKTEFKKGKHYNIKTEFKRGQHTSKETEFKKRHKFAIEIERKRIANSIAGNGRKTIPEKELEKLLNIILPHQYKYVGDGSILIEFFNPDFINKDNNKIIEMFGDYWHNRPEIKKRDYYRFRVFKRNNYRTLVVWEHELKNIEMLITKIRIRIVYARLIIESLCGQHVLNNSNRISGWLFPHLLCNI